MTFQANLFIAIAIGGHLIFTVRPAVASASFLHNAFRLRHGCLATAKRSWIHDIVRRSSHLIVKGMGTVQGCYVMWNTYTLGLCIIPYHNRTCIHTLVCQTCELFTLRSWSCSWIHDPACHGSMTSL